MGAVYYKIYPPRYRFVYWCVDLQKIVRSSWFRLLSVDDQSFLNHVWSALEMYPNGYHLYEVEVQS